MTSAAADNLGVRNLAAITRFAERAVLSLAFLIAGGAFSLQLSGLDPHAPVGPDGASVRSEVAVGFAILVLLLFGVSAWRTLLTLLKTNALLIALPTLAMLSALWAPEPAVTVRRAMAFSGTVLCGFAVAACLPGEAALRFLARTIGAAVVLSIAYAVIRPDYGVHQLTDGVQSVHAGDWRGLFVHRTALGQLAALGLVLTVYSVSKTFGHPAIRLGVALASLLCLMMAHSGGALASAVILLATPVLLTAGRRLARRNGLIAIGLGVTSAVLAALLAPMLAPLILHGLGKDATLTGRTDLWRLMMQAAAERPLLGYGYSTGFRQVVARLVSARSPYGYVPNAQDGYLDVLLNLGLAGLGLALAVLALATWRAVRSALQPVSGGLALMPLLIVVFIIEMNVVEAALISANDIFVLIYTTALIASGDLLRTRPHSDPPPQHAPRRRPEPGTNR